MLAQRVNILALKEVSTPSGRLLVPFVERGDNYNVDRISSTSKVRRHLVHPQPF